MTLKVCMVVYGDYSADARVQSYASALADAGARVDVICPGAPARLTARPRAGVRVLPIPARRVTGGQRSQMLSWAMTLLMVTPKLSRLALRHRYDVVHVHNMPNLLIFAAILPRLLGAKLILDIHDLMPEVYMSQRHCDANHFVVRMLRLEEKLSAAFAHAVITACDSFRERLEQRSAGPGRVTVVYNVPNPGIFKRSHLAETNATPRPFTLIYAGTIVPRYGLAVAVRALPILAQRIGDVRLLLVGRCTPHATELLELAERLGVASLIDYRPGVLLEEVAELLAQADVGIYTALPDPHMSMAVPGKVLECAAMGVPVVASRLEVLERLFPRSAIMLFDPGDQQQFAECVVRLAEQPALRAALVHAMDDGYIRTHGWKSEMKVYLDLLNRLLSQANVMNPAPLMGQDDENVRTVLPVSPRHPE